MSPEPRSLVEDVKDRLGEMEEVITSERFDLVTVDGWGDELARMERAMRDASCLLKYERRYSDEITLIEQVFITTLEALQIRKRWLDDNDLRSEIPVSWADDW